MESRKQASGKIQSAVVSHSNPTRSSSNASVTLGDRELNENAPNASSSPKRSLESTKAKHLEKGDDLVSTVEDVVEPDFPDGGWRAWSVVFGAACVTISTFGYVNSWGAFQLYYENVKFPNQSPSSIAWVGSIQYSLIFVPGLFVGRLFDRGHFRLPFTIANILLIVATFLIAECKSFWEIVLCQGILTGVACGIMFSPLLALVSHWFDKRRGLAYGFMAVGSSIGGTVFPILVRALLPSVGFKWTMRILGFTILGITSIANVMLRRRLDPVKPKGNIINLAQLKNASFSIYAIASLISFLGLYTVLTYIATFATQRGVPQSMSYNLVSIANASSLIGRLASGILADRYGPLNVMIPFTIAAAIFTYTWPFTDSLGAIIGVTIPYGISSGAFVALFGSPVVSMGSPTSVGERTGLLFSFTALGALAGPPISGAIRNGTGSWNNVGYYAGSTIVLSVILMWITRFILTKHPYRGVI